jgi:uncharacterized protein YkwD
MRGGLFLIVALAASSGCTTTAALAPAPPATGIAAPPVALASATAPAPTPAWAPVTRSPSSVEADRDARESALATACGSDDGALFVIARELVELRARGLGTPDAETLVAKLRAAGQPYVRPRVIVASGQAPIDDAKLKAALVRSASTKAPVRCGVAIAKTPHGGEVLLALRVEALADLAPLPTRARTGEWMSFEAHLHVPARSAKLIVLGPRGAPRTVPTSLDGASGIARARFALDQPGGFTVQLVGDLAEGPRPLLEARMFADVTPPAPGEEPPAPGEEEGAALVETGSDALSLARMVGALRSLEGAPPLARDEKLETLARAHAERMRDRRSVAHDLGDGDFKDRFEAEGTLDARAVGENVAHAPTVALAHRALHASPSHRINLLRVDYTHMGVGVARAADGSVYVCETFAATSRANANNAAR